MAEKAGARKESAEPATIPTGNATDAHYRITHPGGTIDRWYDQTVHGSTWQYVDELWLTAGQSLTVELVGDATTGSWLSADAVRIGGGMDDISRHGETTALRSCGVSLTRIARPFILCGCVVGALGFFLQESVVQSYAPLP